MVNIALAAEVAVLLVLAYGVGAMAGYGLHHLLAMPRKPQRAVETAPVVRQASPSPAARLALAATDDEIAPVAKAPSKLRDPQPKSLPAPRDGIKDDLRQIRGIGPKIDAMLSELGIFHYDQIAAWTPSNMEWMDHKLGFKGRVGRENWVGQARLLAKPPVTAPRKIA